MSSATRWERVRNMIGVASDMTATDQLMAEDFKLFEDWVKRGLISKAGNEGWCITPQGEVEFWALREPGSREREIGLLLGENGLSVIDDVIKSQSVFVVAERWNPFVAGWGLILSGMDVYRMLARWIASPPAWLDDSRRERMVKVGVECPAA